MQNCKLIKGDGTVCHSAYGINYVYLLDAGDLLSEKVSICQIHSDEIFGGLMGKELSAKYKITKLYSELSVIRKKGFNSKQEKEVIYKNKQIDSWKELLKNFRNKYCRLCNHPLKCDCEQCKQRHEGTMISSATLFSSNLYRRSSYNFHKICGRIFFSRFGFMLIPTVNKQKTLEEITL